MSSPRKTFSSSDLAIYGYIALVQVYRTGSKKTKDISSSTRKQDSNHLDNKFLVVYGELFKTSSF